jgi:hypothetical protein
VQTVSRKDGGRRGVEERGEGRDEREEDREGGGGRWDVAYMSLGDRRRWFLSSFLCQTKVHDLTVFFHSISSAKMHYNLSRWSGR